MMYEADFSFSVRQHVCDYEGDVRTPCERSADNRNANTTTAVDAFCSNKIRQATA
jgi:hypothetical protein